MDILQMSISASVMIVAVVIIRALTLHKLPKKTFLVLWGVVICRLLIPFSIPSRFSFYTGIDMAKRMFTEKTAASSPVEMTIAPGVVNMPSSGKPIEMSASAASSISPIEIVWLIGLCAFVVFFTVIYIKCRREFKTSLPAENDFAACWLRENTLRRTVQIRQSDRIKAPLTYGIFRPVVLLPTTTDWMDETKLRYILTHEFTHIRRFDTLTKLALAAAVCVHWFNPLVWVMYVLANHDIELSCDETVVRTFGETMKSAYALTLIGLEEKKSRLTPLVNSFSKNAIEERITAIMKIKKTSLIGIILALALVVGTTIIFATNAANTTKDDDPINLTGLTDARQKVSFPIFVPTEVPDGLDTGHLTIDEGAPTHVRIAYLTEYGSIGLSVLNSPAGSGLDFDPRKKGETITLRGDIPGHFLKNQPQFGGPILWWDEAGSYVALSGPELNKADLVKIAESMSSTAGEAEPNTADSKPAIFENVNNQLDRDVEFTNGWRSPLVDADENGAGGKLIIVQVGSLKNEPEQGIAVVCHQNKDSEQYVMDDQFLTPSKHGAIKIESLGAKDFNMSVVAEDGYTWIFDIYNGFQAGANTEPDNQAVSTAAISNLDWVWPVEGCDVIFATFGMNYHPIEKVKKFNDNIQITGKGIRGAAVYAALAGTVSEVSFDDEWGNYIMIDHGNGIETFYLHLDELLVSAGDPVAAGDTIGTAGSTGKATGPFLAFGIRIDGKAVDPMDYLQKKS